MLPRGVATAALRLPMVMMVLLTMALAAFASTNPANIHAIRHRNTEGNTPASSI